jgi:hypothetical protein
MLSSDNAISLPKALVLAHGFFLPRVVRLIWANTAGPSSLRQWTVATAILALDRKYYA